MIPLTAILARLRAARLLESSYPEGEILVEGISDDSRQVQVGELYCAIKGYVHDGHSYLRDVAAAGAAAALVEEPEVGLELPQVRVRDSRRAAAIAAQVVYGEPAAGMKLVGVTGTNGKTTTVHLARHVLSGLQPTGSLGTLGVVDAGGSALDLGLTTPGPVEFARRLAELKRGGTRYVVAEISSHALTQGRVDGAAFAAGVFTNLSRDHLDYHSDFHEYRAAKLRLAELVAPGGVLVLNADEPAWSALRDHQGSVTFGLQAAANYRADGLVLSPAGSTWTLVAPDGEVNVDLPLLGEFNVSNALAAAALAGALGMAVPKIGERLATVPAVPGRLERLGENPLILRDYAHTPDALGKALTALRPLVRGRLLVVFGCGGDRDKGKRPLMGRAAAEGADYSIVTSDNPRTERPEAIIDDILLGIGSATFERIVDRREAIARAIEIAGPDDVVLLAGKGHEAYQVVGTERRPFDEALIVSEMLTGGRGRC
ncbi:MAG: UDP-N-acetylmuramoyl-L-alanyl-D-glutamate--2,6-diaminopimelate ligase [Gemmatimonadota bacterium]|nr:MAG: UDP-N-acetylmuramoyl-L-alanyl-D-glutamate--2,6-diaminopimelate ligase [Gemmatimonadota bacterium]